MSTVFRQIRLFLSSTFRDMNAERDHLVKFIFPRLNDYCNSRHLEFVPIDLRWGIPEEDSRNGLVLSACLEEIDNSRPFFIGILGSRYGWIPSQSDLNILSGSLERIRPWLHDEILSARSITEMEIEYGVLREMNTPHAAFYFRNEQVEIPADCREVPGSAAEQKLQNLKQRIRRQKHRYPVAEYRTPEELGQMIYDRVVTMINAEYPPEADDEYDSIVGIQRYALETNGHAFINTEQLWSLFESHIEKHTKLLFFNGAPGSEILHSMAVAVKILSKKYKEVHYFDFEYAPEGVPPIAAFKQWAELELNPTDKSKWRYVAIDNCSLLNIDESYQLSDWIKNQPEDTYIAVGGSYRSPIYSTLYWRFSPNGITCNGLSPEDRRTYIDNYTQYYGKRLTHQQLDTICSGKSTSDPTVLQLICQELVNFGSMEKLDERIAKLLEKHTDHAFLFWDLILETKAILLPYNMAFPFAKATIILSIINNGITERDIRELCHLSQAKWSTIRPFILRFCKRCGDRISYVFDAWGQMVTNIWNTPFRVEVTYEILTFYFNNLQQGHINQYTVGKILNSLWNYIYLPHEDTKYADMYDNILKNTHSACMSPDVARSISNHDYSSIWSILYQHGKLSISDTPFNIYGRTIDELGYEEYINFYQRLADICNDLGYTNDAAWAYKNVAEIKTAHGDEDAALSNVSALLSLGRVSSAIQLLDSFDNSHRPSAVKRLFGHSCLCSNETVLKSAILRFKANVSIGKYYHAIITLSQILKRYATDDGRLDALVAEACNLIRSFAAEYNFLDYTNIPFKQNIYEYSLTAKSLALYFKANMFISLHQLKDYNKAIYWAEWYWYATTYSNGTKPVLIKAKMHYAFLQMLNYGKQDVYDKVIVGVIPSVYYKPIYKFLTGDNRIDLMDIEYRQELFAEAKRFRDMLTEIEKGEYKQYNKTMPQKQYDEEMAELEAYRSRLCI